ncbi:hypothetical protein [Nocardia jiangxiensis]|uniref:hypothetical protein n=1 Tax=Nocardia jiangxiensis TaxID=282685 RepID=UPI0002DB3982|nr:hypothetical protein [Nocardia jiangxiensis]
MKKYRYTYITDPFNDVRKSKTIEADRYDVGADNRMLHFYRINEDGTVRTIATINSWETVREVSA